MVESVCVYCASSAKVDPIYLDAAAQLGELLAKQKVQCIYGAGHIGLMGTLADAVMSRGGEVTGVIPRFMLERNWHHQSLENIIITETMHERKAKMASLAEAAVALPGGCGTLEELLEIITWKQLGLFPKPIVIVNTNGYYNPLIEMLQKAIDERFMREEHGRIWIVVEDAMQVLDAIANEPRWDENTLDFAVV